MPGLGLAKCSSVKQSTYRHSVHLLKYILFLLLVSIACRSGAQDFLSVGARGGVSFNGNKDRFRQAEIFTDFDIPWKWNFYSDWQFQPRFDLSAGWLEGENTGAFIGTTGPELVLRKGTFPLTLEGGCSPTILSHDTFGQRDFGDRVQFTSHISVNWDITKHIGCGYRFQHMSNAGLAAPNPGLNLQMLYVSYHF